MICNKCGKMNPDAAAFCRFCGNNLKETDGNAAGGINRKEDNVNYTGSTDASGDRRISAAHARLMNMEEQNKRASNYAGAPAAHSPYGGTPNPNDPYGRAPNSGGLYGGTPNPNDSYGRTPNSGGPYGGTPNPNDPYGRAPNSGGFYGGTPNPNDPYGRAPNPNDPYGRATNPGGPYGRNPDGRSPYGMDPYGGARGKTAPVLSQWMIIVLAEAAAAFIILIIAITMISSGNSVDKKVEKFFVAVVNGNYKKAFSSMNLEKDKFINPSEFKLFLAQEDFSEVDNFTVQDYNDTYDAYGYGVRAKNNELGRTYTILYRNKGEASDSSIRIDMVKSGKSGKWYVSSGMMIVEQPSIRVLRGAKLTIDGIEVPEKYASDETDEYYNKEITVYTIPRMFEGSHYVSVTAEGYQETRRVWDLYDSYSLDLTDMLYSNETLDALQAQSVNNMQRIYQAVLHDESFDAIADLFTADPESREDIKSDYEDLRDNMRRDDWWVTSMDMKEIQAVSSAYWPHADLSFTCSGGYKEKNYSGEVQSYTGESSCSLNFNFIQENGVWVQSSLGCERIYF